MPKSKIVDETEVIRWFEEGRTYEWMTDTYLEKYHIETSPSMWGNFRRRRGLDRRNVRNDDLIPWHVRSEHRWAYPLAMLRSEARLREGVVLREMESIRLDGFKRGLKQDDLVIHYDPDTDEGFFYVPRREGVDTDLIRKPDRKTTLRPAAD